VELANAWATLSDQGVMFWTAAGAVALGITLILISGVIQFRRLRGRATGQISEVPEYCAKPAHKVLDVPLNQESPRATDASAEKTMPGQFEENSGELLLLLARLRSAADQLEDYRHARLAAPHGPAQSSLKESCTGVDYVFRAGTG